jgi:hypothetical protein
MSVVGTFSRPQIGEGGAENNRFASKVPNALTFSLSDGFIEKVRLLVRPPIKSRTYAHFIQTLSRAEKPSCTLLCTHFADRRKRVHGRVVRPIAGLMVMAESFHTIQQHIPGGVLVY